MAAIELTTSVEDLSAGDLEGFFVGWRAPLSPEQHLDVLRRSYRAVLARDTRTGHVVGFVTAISDGVLSAYIPLLEVLPGYQGHGIGTALMRRLLAELEGLYMVDLACDADLVPFYERLGLRRGEAVMGIRNFGALGASRRRSEPD